jgi:SEC-C motif-containing protein
MKSEQAGQAAKLDSALGPGELLLARCRAFGRGDFGFIFDSYHPDSNFRRHFPDRGAYIAQGHAVLATEFAITECRLLRERVEGDEARVIFYLDCRFRGIRQESFELALLLRTDEGWRYHSAQKLERSEYSGAIAEIGWDDFERAREKVFF